MESLEAEFSWEGRGPIVLTAVECVRCGIRKGNHSWSDQACERFVWPEESNSESTGVDVINVNVIQCSHLNPKETWPYVSGRCNNDSLSGRAYCEGHKDEEEE
jgi:hypothetical protein